MIAIIDYDAGNIKSVEKAFQFLGQDTILSRAEMKYFQQTRLYYRELVLLVMQ